MTSIEAAEGGSRALAKIDPIKVPAVLSTRVDPDNLQVDEGLKPFVSFRGYVLFGVIVVLLSLGGLGVWSYLAPLSRGAVAPGVISVESSLKTVQHLEGGIIKEILVSDGDRVEAGQPLLVIDPTRSRANVEILRKQLAASLAHEARLIAQRDDLEALVFPDELMDVIDDPEMMEIVINHQSAFDQHRSMLSGRREGFEKQMEQSLSEKRALEQQISAFNGSLTLVQQEIEIAQRLVDQGLERMPRLLAAMRAAEGLKSDIAGTQARIAGGDQRVTETELRQADFENQLRNQSIQELRQVQERIADIREQLRAQTDVLDRTFIVAPQGGLVHNRRFGTVGGVIGPGEPIVDIVPIGDDLVVNAQVQPQDKDALWIGLQARVILSALPQRTTPQLDGEVVHVSAERLTDEVSGAPFFEARVQIDASKLSDDQRAKLYPGMPAEVVFVTGERTVVDFLTEPLTDAIRRGPLAD